MPAIAKSAYQSKLRHEDNEYIEKHQRSQHRKHWDRNNGMHLVRTMRAEISKKFWGPVDLERLVCENDSMTKRLGDV